MQTPVTYMCVLCGVIFDSRLTHTCPVVRMENELNPLRLWLFTKYIYHGTSEWIEAMLEMDCAPFHVVGKEPPSEFVQLLAEMFNRGQHTQLYLVR